jgi:hypothetical protein
MSGRLSLKLKAKAPSRNPKPNRASVVSRERKMIAQSAVSPGHSLRLLTLTSGEDETMGGVEPKKLTFCDECGNALHTECFQQCQR